MNRIIDIVGGLILLSIGLAFMIFPLKATTTINEARQMGLIAAAGIIYGVRLLNNPSTTKDGERG